MAKGTIRLDLADEEATRLFGVDLAMVLERGDVVALEGDLGVGKSTLARSVIRALAGDPDLEVPSPTFTLVQSYSGRIPVQHFDLYRLSSADELDELGLAEAIRDGAVLIEWPQRASDTLPSQLMTVRLEENGAGRRALVGAPDAFLARLRRSLAIRSFLDEAGMHGAHRRFLIGDASTRAYETVTGGSGETLILMNAPRRPDGPSIRDGKPYSQIAHLAESVTPFVAIASVLRERGFRAPRIPAADMGAGLLLVEHLGDEGVLDAEGRPIEERYLAAAGLLADMHRLEWPSRIDVAPGVTHLVPRYDRGALAIETELLTDWYLPHVAGRRATDAQRETFRRAWASAFDRFDQTEQSLVLRDFHSPNIIWRAERSGRDRLGLIDFQDALMGPSAYDVASLAMDARVTIDPDLEESIVETYCAARARAGSFDREAFEAAYAIAAAQRNSKILGIFVRLNVRDGKPGYLRHLPRIRDYVARALRHPALDEVRRFYEDAGILETVA